MSEATLVNNGETLQKTAGAGYDCGDIIQIGGLAGVVEGLCGVANGDPLNARVKGQFDVASASATTFAEGATVEWDDTNKLAVAAAAGDFVLGKAAKAKTAGQTVVRVILNE